MGANMATNERKVRLAFQTSACLVLPAGRGVFKHLEVVEGLVYSVALALRIAAAIRRRIRSILVSIL